MGRTMISKSYHLPPDIDERLSAHVASGAYQTQDDVLREALDALEQRERAKLEEWHRKNAIAIEQSLTETSQPLDLDAILERVEARIAKHTIK
jgi:Arc/MetJ-type ribon-helix-helix transcriptional regulator